MLDFNGVSNDPTSGSLTLSYIDPKTQNIVAKFLNEKIMRSVGDFVPQEQNDLEHEGDRIEDGVIEFNLKTITNDRNVE